MKEILNQEQIGAIETAARENADRVGSLGWDAGGQDLLLEIAAQQLYGVDVEFQGGVLLENKKGLAAETN